METFGNKTISMTSNKLNLSNDAKRHFKLEPLQPLLISEISYLLDGLKKLDEKFQFMILWEQVLLRGRISLSEVLGN
jgi:hypothetical protein